MRSKIILAGTSEDTTFPELKNHLPQSWYDLSLNSTWLTKVAGESLSVERGKELFDTLQTEQLLAGLRKRSSPTKAELACFILQSDKPSDEPDISPATPASDHITLFHQKRAIQLASDLLQSISYYAPQEVKDFFFTEYETKIGSSVNCFGNNLLHIAAILNQPQVITAYLADINVQNNAGFTPLMLTIKMHQPTTLIDTLIKAGANPQIGNHRDNHKTAIDYAREQRRSDIVASLKSAPSTAAAAAL